MQTAIKSEDIQLWQEYKATNSTLALSKLLKQMEPVIHSVVNKWVGNISREVLMNEAKLLAKKAFDTYDPAKGTALSTHLVTSLAPISRTVYTYQNVARLPENITLKLNTFNSAKDTLTSFHGREPTTDELHQELGWSAKEINRLNTYQRRDLVESVGAVKGDAFFSDKEDKDADILSAVYFSLMPDEKTLFEYVTGFNGKPRLTNPEIMAKMNITQAQLSYKKTLLTNKLSTMLSSRTRR